MTTFGFSFLKELFKTYAKSLCKSNRTDYKTNVSSKLLGFLSVKGQCRMGSQGF